MDFNYYECIACQGLEGHEHSCRDNVRNVCTGCVFTRMIISTKMQAQLAFALAKALCDHTYGQCELKCTPEEQLLLPIHLCDSAFRDLSVAIKKWQDDNASPAPATVLQEEPQ